MNTRLVCKLLGRVSLLIGVTMLFSLPWAFPSWGNRHPGGAEQTQFEQVGFVSLIVSMVACWAVGGVLLRAGRGDQGQLFRKEAMAVVGLTWVLATVLGALPFYLSGTRRSAAVRLARSGDAAFIYRGPWHIKQWDRKDGLSPVEHRLVTELVNAGAKGIAPTDLDQLGNEFPEAQQNPAEVLRRLTQDLEWRAVIRFPGDDGLPDRTERFRVRWVPMTIVDSLFESQSGFSTTGATVIADLEDPILVPHCILFWRSSTHFLGGLGIIVLFVAVLGQGSAGKALMRAEMPGPSKEGSQARMQHTAWLFAAIYCGLNVVLTVALWQLGLTWFDALCHAFGTMATGGFSTYNKSLGHFDSAAIDYLVILFMVLAGTNFTLLYFLLQGKPGRLLKDIEWRAYIGIILVITLVVVVFGHGLGDFSESGGVSGLASAVRYGLFQVVSIMTTTGYGTHDFDAWNSFGRGALLLLMFVGGCAGSTGGGLKVIRWVLLVKIMGLELEQTYHPTVVRPLRLGGKPVEDVDLRKNILVYFSIIMLIYAPCWLFVVGFEPQSTWGDGVEHKLVDSASAVAATLNNIGPGLGTVGATQNYSHFSWPSKLLFTWLMMVGRVEVFAIVVLFLPSFWRTR